MEQPTNKPSKYEPSLPLLFVSILAMMEIGRVITAGIRSYVKAGSAQYLCLLGAAIALGLIYSLLLKWYIRRRQAKL